MAATLRRLLILIIAATAVGLLVFFVQRYQISRMNQSVLSRAAEAEKSGKFDAASRLYQEHLELVPADQDAKVKLATVLTKGEKTPANRDRAAALYGQVLARDAGQREIRRSLAELEVERKRWSDAEAHLNILISDAPRDGELYFLLGRCQEELAQHAQASKSYASAIENHVASPRLVEAYRRRAFLLRGRLNDPAAADKAIEDMIAAEPKDPEVYLVSGRYRWQFEKDSNRAKADFGRALELEKASGTPSSGVYLELANLAAAAGDSDAARGYLEAGLKGLPKEDLLYDALATLEARAGSAEKAMAVLGQGLALIPNSPILHWSLANHLAERGETAGLAAQIEELRRLTFSPALVEFLEGYLQFNSKNWDKSRQTLLKLRLIFDQSPDFKARLYYLLARCYGNMGQADLQREAYAQAVGANPNLIQAQLGLASNLVDRGETDQAIEIYRKLAARLPAVRPMLARLLIAKNRQLPVPDRRWTEVEDLIKKVATDLSIESSEAIILQTDMLLVQGKEAEARKLLDEERTRRPKAADVWIKSAELLRRQGLFSQAKELLDRAEAIVLDEQKAPREKAADLAQQEAIASKLVGARLERARLLIAEKAADLPGAIRQITRGAASLPQASRRRLLEGLAIESASLNDTALIREIWLEIAGIDPRALPPQIRLLELALTSQEARQEGAQKAIEAQLAKVREIDGSDGLMTRYYECRYLMWQASRKNDQIRDADGAQGRGKSDQLILDRNDLRTTARNLLNELRSRSNWSMIPLALGSLTDEEMTDQVREFKGGTEEEKAQIDRKKREAANYYLEAVQGGQRNVSVVRRAYDLFYEMGDQDKQAQLWNALPGTESLRSNLDVQASQRASSQKEYGKAMELAQKALADNPKDARARLWLAQLQTADQQLDQAEQTLRQGDPEHTSPELQLTLIRFLAFTRQIEKAEQALSQAEEKLKDRSPQGPLTLARCCEAIGQALKAVGQDEQKLNEWNDKASQWYRAAERSRPDDFDVNRQFVDFQLRTGQFTSVKEYLTKILKDEKRAPEHVVWARRSLALALLISNDYEQVRQCLELVKPIEEALQKKETVPPEDLRILSRVYEAQRVPEYHEKARKVLENVVAGGSGVPDDRLLLAAMYSKDGDWSAAREQYDRVMSDTENSRSLEVLTRRPDYLARYVRELLAQHQVRKDAELLDKAEELVAKLGRLSPNLLSAVLLEARVAKAKDQPGKAEELLEAPAKDPKVSDSARQTLAREAEDLGLTDLAERLLQEAFNRSDIPQNRLALASFRGRHGRVKEALDLCEPLWKQEGASEAMVRRLSDIVFSSTGKNDQAQVDRLAGWMEGAIKQKPDSNSSTLMMSLANLRERQGKFQDAEELYRREIGRGGDDIIALNNLAWLMALRNDKSGDALKLINQAITRKGPVPELLDTRGVVHLKSGDLQRAVQDLTRAAQLDPSGPKLFHLAEAYLQANNRQNASQAFEKARAKGLRQEDLHPLEVATYQRLLNDLGVR